MKINSRKQIFFILFFALSRFLSGYGSDLYWDLPFRISQGQGKFPVSDFNNQGAVVLWQEHKENDNNTYLSSLYMDKNGEKTLSRFFAGPISYGGEEPALSSVTITGKGDIYAVAPVDSNFLGVYFSEDKGRTYSQVLIEANSGKDFKKLVAPRIYELGGGGFIIFAAKAMNDVLSIYYSISEDGKEWSGFKPFSPVEKLGASFLPVHISFKNLDYVVFQSMLTSPKVSFQLYVCYSGDNGHTWSEPVILTDFKEPFGEKKNSGFENFDNQRPALGIIRDSPFVVWERAVIGGATEIYGAAFGTNGIIPGSIEKISPGYGHAYNPVIADTLDNPTVIWYDDRLGENSIYMSQKNGFFWEEKAFAEGCEGGIFPCPVVVNSDLYLFFQKNLSDKTTAVMQLSPDKFVDKPLLKPLNFTAGREINKNNCDIEVILPEDKSGISGFSWVFTRSPGTEPPLVISNLPYDNRISCETTEDGSWFFTAKVKDAAGNWSEPVNVEFVRDTTPPVKPDLKLPEIDGRGFALSNTFSLSWSHPEPDIAGYNYSLSYLGNLGYAEKIIKEYSAPDLTDRQEIFEYAQAEGKLKPPMVTSRVFTNENSYSAWNIDNGLYAFSVSARDAAGNTGESKTVYLLFDKYVPYTTITAIDGGQDRTGILNLTIVGKGFSSEGLITSVYLDKDGTAPWDYELDYEKGDFKIYSDKIINDISIPDMTEGDYHIILNHSARGFYKSREKISVLNFGTVKFGDYSFDYKPSLQVLNNEKSLIYIGDIIFYIFMSFVLICFILALYGIIRTVMFNVKVKHEILYLLEDTEMNAEKKHKVSNIPGYRFSLKLKLTFFTGILVMAVVLLVSIPLGRNMIRTQEESLVKGLEVKTTVLLESIASGARIYLPSKNVLELGFLPEQSRAMEEALYATITGFGSQEAEKNISHVWATNDTDILDKINTGEYEAGVSVITDELSVELENLRKELDSKAEKSVGALASGINDLTREGIEIVQETQTQITRKRLQDIQTVTRNLEEQLNLKLNDLSRLSTGAWPEYPQKRFDKNITEYIFYKPILYRTGDTDSYVQGIVRIGISTRGAIAALSVTIKNLIFTTLIVALIAIAIGIGGALILASVIVSPIIKLVSHVEKIGATEDKEKLEGQDIYVKSRDEIGLLGNTINEMAHGLIKAAAASKDLSIGKEIQKMFLPLETDKNGAKLSTGVFKEKNITLFGYYEGAKGVSGDYFDYIKLNDRYYAVIKCDIAGKGVSAALIMVEVATLFQSYFKDWKNTSEALKIDKLVALINDTIEKRGFNGRFAAFTLVIIDCISLNAFFCNAGDNLVHVFKRSTGKMDLIKLPQVSAAGVFPSDLIELKGGFPVVKYQLEKGDVLFLYTDGIEESKRFFRNSEFEVLSMVNSGINTGLSTDGIDNEELGMERVHRIIESVFAKEKYVLDKMYNPRNENLVFDFSGLSGSLEDAVMALVSVEKIFRMYKDYHVSEDDLVNVDKKIDAFLKKTFNGYKFYCGTKKEDSEHKEYLYYTGIKEDEQYDDLTILGIEIR